MPLLFEMESIFWETILAFESIFWETIRSVVSLPFLVTSSPDVASGPFFKSTSSPGIAQPAKKTGTYVWKPIYMSGNDLHKRTYRDTTRYARSPLVNIALKGENTLYSVLCVGGVLVVFCALANCVWVLLFVVWLCLVVQNKHSIYGQLVPLTFS